MKKIISVQDLSCFGQCSLTVALPILSSYGVETAILPSALLSTHTGGFHGVYVKDLTKDMSNIIEHWSREGLVFDGIYTGYIGDAAQFEVIKSMRGLLRERALLMVDPAMADHGKLYSGLGPDIVDGMRDLVREADLILPNLTEAALLLGVPYEEKPDRGSAELLVRRLAELGPERVILTGISFAEDKIGAMAYEKTTDAVTVYQADRVGGGCPGTGDAFASVLVGNLMNGVPMAEALEDSCEFVRKAIAYTIGMPDHRYGVCFERVLAERSGHRVSE